MIGLVRLDRYPEGMIKKLCCPSDNKIQMDKQSHQSQLFQSGSSILMDIYQMKFHHRSIQRDMANNQILEY